jgi:ABC-type Na+ efflux pump permease subunit
MKIITILLIIGMIIIFSMGRTSGYERKKTPGDVWKPLDDVMPSLSRFRNVDKRTYATMLEYIEEAKKNTSDLAISMRFLRKAVDEFASLSVSLPSGDSDYHDEIAGLAIELGVVGESVLMDIAEEKGKPFTPVFHNELNH